MSAFAEFRALDRRIWYLAGARLVVTGGFAMVLPFLAMYLTEQRKLPAVVAGLIWTIAGACGAGMQWVAGELADRVGRCRVMIASMLVRAVNLAALGYVIASGRSVMIIAALVIGNSMLRAFFDPVANALVADLSPPEQRVAAFSLQRVGINIGWAAGPALAGLAARHSYSFLFYWSVPVTLIATLGVALIREPPTAHHLRPPPHWRELLAFRDDKPFVRFLFGTISMFVLQVQLYQTLSIYAARVLHLGLAQVGKLYMVNGLLVVALQLPAVKFIRRVGTRRTLVLGCFVYAASYASIGLALGYASLIVCVALLTLAEMITAPAQQATVTSLAPLGRVGAYAGLFGLCQVVGQSAGPLIGTGALDALPPRAAWFFLALFGVVAGLIYRSKAATATAC